MNRLVSIILLVWLLPLTSVHAAEELDVLVPSADGVAPGQKLEVWLKNEFYKQGDGRSAAFGLMLKSEAACRTWQAERREFFLRQIGELPQRTPLNPRIVGTLQGQGYRVEKILLESRPNFHVSANLYLPESSPPWPAVLIP